MWNASLEHRQPTFNFFADPKRLEESHRRSQAAGVSRDLARLKQELNDVSLNNFIACHAALSTYSHLIFSDIYRDLSDCNYLFILTDNAGRLIALYSCPDILDDAMEEIGLHPGVFLSLESCGTNAVALALQFREPAVVRGEQNYCRLFHRWCTVAVPVMGADRRPMACVAISTYCDAALTEKLPLAKSIAKGIEGFHCATAYALETNRSGARLNGEQRAESLTPRQYQVLTLFAKGLSYKQIARQLDIGSVKTVEEHLDAVRGKLRVSHRRGCIQKAMALGLLQN